MNKILYSPKEGTTGFCGLRGCLEKPEFKEIDSFLESSQKAIYCYHEALEFCKSNKLEIVNPEEVLSIAHHPEPSKTVYFQILNDGSRKQLSPGDIFDLPIGYEFKSYKKCQHNGIHNSTCIYHEVLRLVKTETKDNITAKQTDIEWLSELLSNFDSGPLSQDQCVTLIMKRFEVPQPEPEESQTEIWLEAREFMKVISPNGIPVISMDEKELKKHFTIQRKKQ